MLILAAAASRPARADGPAGLSPTEGPPGVAIQVQGIPLEGVRAKWDPDLPTAAIAPGDLQSAPFFSIPPDAAPGAHSIQLEKDGRALGMPLRFTVLKGPRRRPRLDDVTVTSFRIDGDGRAELNLMAHGANIDVGAKILINGEPQATTFYVLYRNTGHMTASDPSTLGYPIFHYATVYAALRAQTPGSALDITVRNLDGRLSNNVQYRLARSMKTLDSDGDGLSDEWETRGADVDEDGTVDIDLPHLGANPLRKDLYVEVDWMTGHEPNATIWGTVEDAFDSAPVLNSDGSQGISIHIDRGQAGAGGGGGTLIPPAHYMRYDDDTPDPDFVNFYKVKANPANFNPLRLPIYRYCIFANDNSYQHGSSGQAEDIWANDFFVSLGGWGSAGRLDHVQVGTFMHELGHTLNLRHGGFEDTNRKDNYNSIMQYGKRRNSGDQFPASPAQVTGIDVDCNLNNQDFVFTYSQGMRADLNEYHLDERLGVCDHFSMDWDLDGAIEPDVATNLDADPELTIIQDYADWASIEIDFLAYGSHWANN